MTEPEANGKKEHTRGKEEQGPLCSHLQMSMLKKKLIQRQSIVKASLANPLLILFPPNLEAKQTFFFSTMLAKGFLFTLQIQHHLKSKQSS